MSSGRSGWSPPLLASLLLAVLTLSGCGSRPAARPQGEAWPEPEAPRKEAHEPPRRIQRPRTEPAAGEADLPRKGDVSTPFPEAAPSPLATIDATTPPQIAAATRLADQGRALLVENDDGAALETLERAIAIDPSNAYAYYFLAELHFRNRSYEQAAAFADRAAQLSARVDGSWLTRSYCLQGQALEAAGRLADARSAYRRALRAEPRNQTARLGLDRVGAKLGMDREASGD